MTISAYEVAATLAIVDRASPALEKVLGLSRSVAAEFERIKALGKGLFSGTGITAFSTQMAKLDPVLGKTVEGMEAVKLATVKSLRDMNLAIEETKTQAASLRRELGMTESAAKFGFGQGGGGAGGQPRPGPAAVPVPSGGHLLSRSSIGLIAGGAAAYGAFEEGKLRDATARMLFLSGQPLAEMAHQPLFAAMRKQLLDVYVTTGADLEDIEEAGVSVVKLMAGFPVNSRMDVLKTALTFGAQEHRLNPAVSVTSGADALVGLLHQTGTYDPALIQKLTPKIAALSTITNMPLSRVMNAAGYAMPLASDNLGVDSDTILLLMTGMQRAGVVNTKSGTWLRSFVEKSISGTTNVSGHAAEAARKGLTALGLLDKNGKSTVIDKAGHLDLFKEMEIIDAARKRLKGPEFLQASHAAFGIQGGAGMAVLTEPQVLAQLPAMREWMTQMPGGEAFFKDMFEESPAQQGKTTLADFNRNLMDAGSTALPAATEGLKLFNDMLKTLAKTLEGFGVQDTSKATSYGILGGAALAFSPWLRRQAGAAFRMVGDAVGDVARKDPEGLGIFGAILGINQERDLIRGKNGDSGEQRLWNWLHSIPNDPNRQSSPAIAWGREILDAIREGFKSVKIEVEGREIGQVVLKHIGDDSYRPPSGTSSFDIKQSPLYPNYPGR